MLGLRFAEMGIAAALLRRPEEPTEAEQKALLTVYLSIGLTLCTLAFVLAFVVLPWSGLEEEGAQVVAVCCSRSRSTPVARFRCMLIERQLGYGRIGAWWRPGETLAFNAFALTAALAGLGAFSLAGAIPAAALVGVAIAWRLQPFARGLTPPALAGAAADPLWARPDLDADGQPGRRAGICLGPDRRRRGLARRLLRARAAALRVPDWPSPPPCCASPSPPSRVARRRERRAPRRAGRNPLLGRRSASRSRSWSGAADPLIEVLFGDEWLPVADLLVLGSVGMMLIAAASVPMTSLFLAEGRPAPGRCRLASARRPRRRRGCGHRARQRRGRRADGRG